MLDLSKLFGYSRDLGFITDLRGAIVAATQGAERRLGYSPSELVGLDLPHLDEAGDLRRFLESRPARSRMNLGFHLRTRSGETLTVGALASSLRDESGAPVGWLIAAQDLQGAVAEARRAQPILDALMNSIGAALWTFDRNGTVITWSRACEPAFGVSRERAEGKLSVIRLFPSPAEYRRVIEAADRGGQFSGEIELLGADGVARPHHVSVTPLIGEELSLGYTCVSLDVARRKQVEELQRTYFEQAGEAIVVVDMADLKVIDVNDQACAMFGRTRDELLVMGITELRLSNQAVALEEIVRTLDQKGFYESDREVGLRKDGSSFPCAINIRLISVGGKLLSVTVARDLSAQRRAEEFFRVLFEKASDAILVVVGDGLKVVEVNEAACRLLGYPREEFLKLRVPDIIPPEFRHRVEGVLRVLDGHAGYIRDRRVLLCKDGTKVSTDHAICRLSISGQSYYIASVRDLRPEEQAARELEEAKAFLEHVQENASDGLALLDENGVYIAVNRKLLEIRGIERREDLLGHDWMARSSGRQRAEFQPQWDRLMKGERVSLKTKIERPGGSEVIAEVNASMIQRGSRKFVFAIIRDVTDHVRADEALHQSREDLERHVAERTAQLRESEERFRGAFTQGGIGMALVGTDGRFLQVNRFLCDMLGYEQSQLQKTTFQAITFPGDLEKSADLIRQMIPGDSTSARIEKRYLHHDGRVVWGDLSTTLIRDARGNPLYFVTTIQDITERKRAEEELRESEGRYRALAEHSGVGVWQITPSGETIFINPVMCSILGVQGKASMTGRSFYSFFAPESAELLKAEHEKRGLGLPPSCEVEILRTDGARRQLALFGAPMNSPEGEFRSMIGTFIDITERKRAEGELRESERRFRAITEGVPVAVVIARTSDGTILYANEAAAGALGLPQGGVEGHRIPEFLARPEDRTEVQQRLLREEFVRDLELQFRRRDGSLFWGISALRVASFKGEPATLGVFSDITARKEAQEILRKAHEELERRVVIRTAELGRANSLLQEEIAERKRAENALRLLLEGTAAVTGGSFFRSLVRHLATALDVRIASVVQGVNQPRGQARQIASWDGQEFREAASYPLEGTPCADVLTGESCSYGHDVQRLFPQDQRLSELKAESYLGVPMLDSSGSVVGILTVMDVKPVSDEELKLSVLKIFAARAGVELERKLAEDALRESEERWKALVTNAPDIITTVDQEGRIQSINRVLPGHRVEDVIGKSAYDFVPPDWRDHVRQALGKVFQEGTPVSYEVQATGPHGTIAWYSSRVGPVVLDGRVVAATIVSTDITERRKGEERQNVQAEVTQLLSEAVSLKHAAPGFLRRICQGLEWEVGLLWRIDPDEGVLRLFEAWHPSDEVFRDFVQELRLKTVAPGQGGIGQVWKDRTAVWSSNFPRERRSGGHALSREAGLQAGFILPVEGSSGVLGVLEFLSREKRERDDPLLGTVSTLASQLGQFIERRQAEEDLRFQKILLESQSEAAIDGILVVSRSGMMTSFNRRFCHMWEIPDEVLRSRRDDRALESIQEKLIDPDEFIARVQYLYEHPNEESRDEIHLKDGRVFDRYSAPVKGGGGVLYGRVWYFRDVTGRKRTEENLRRAAEETRQMYEDLKAAQAQLIRSEKLASIGMLVSGVAHEINNPLNVMYGNLQLLAEVSDGLLPLALERARTRGIRGTATRVAKFRGMIRDALKAARHARGIVHDFRNFARDTRTAELVDLNECLEEAVTLIQREMRPGIRILRKLGRIPHVRCLRGQMSQVFLNLLKNAGEAIEKRGTITLRTQQKRGQVLVEIADTGRGMAEEVRKKLFEPFFTTKPVGKGLGLGLSISAMIVHNHNGRITVRSRPGRGSLFRVELPLMA